MTATPTCGTISKIIMLKTLISLFWTFRDLLVLILPASFAKFLVGKGEFVFLAHPLDLLPDIARKYPIASRMPKWLLKIISRYHPPTILGKVKGFRKQDGSIAEGWIVFCSLSTRMMVLKEALAKKKILQAAKFSEKLGGKILGLGAFVPIMTEDGTYLKGKTKMALTTGSAFSAVIAIQNVLKASKLAKLDFKKCNLAVIGAAGSVGSVCAKALARDFENILLIDKNIPGLDKISTSLKQAFNQKNIIQSDDINKIKDADIVLVVTNTPGAIVRSTHLKPGAMIVDAAQPRNVSIKVPHERKDVVVIESGIAEADSITVDCNIGFESKKEVYSCLAEVLILTWMQSFGDHVGDVDFDYAMKLWEVADKAGVRVGRFRSCLGMIDEGFILDLAPKGR